MTEVTVKAVSTVLALIDYILRFKVLVQAESYLQ